MTLYLVVAISVKDEKGTGKGYAKIMPIMDTHFWGKDVPGAKFDKYKLSKSLNSLGIYDLDIKTTDIFSMPQHEIIEATYVGSAASIVSNNGSDVFN